MITLTIILVLLFVPLARRTVFSILSSVLGALGIVFLVTRNQPLIAEVFDANSTCDIYLRHVGCDGKRYRSNVDNLAAEGTRNLRELRQAELKAAIENGIEGEDASNMKASSLARCLAQHPPAPC